MALLSFRRQATGNEGGEEELGAGPIVRVTDELLSEIVRLVRLSIGDDG